MEVFLENCNDRCLHASMRAAFSVGLWFGLNGSVYCLSVITHGTVSALKFARGFAHGMGMDGYNASLF